MALPQLPGLQAAEVGSLHLFWFDKPPLRHHQSPWLWPTQNYFADSQGLPVYISVSIWAVISEIPDGPNKEF